MVNVGKWWDLVNGESWQMFGKWWELVNGTNQGKINMCMVKLSAKIVL